MISLHRAALVALLSICAAAHALATPHETITFSGVPMNGLPGSSANAIRTHVFVGGYPLGRVTLTGTLTSVRPTTWRTDARIDVTAPDGQVVTFFPFLTGTTYSTLAFSGQIMLAPGTNAAGTWSIRFSEEIDDGGTSNVDAMCTLTLTLTDEPAQPPASINLGVVAAPGLNVTNQTIIPDGQLRWYRFQIAQPAQSERASYLDLDTHGSVTSGGPPGGLPGDLAFGLYNALGHLVASDQDSCDGYGAQMSFGIGTRPPTGDGQPYAGQHGPLAAGTYYLCVGANGLQFGPNLWLVAANSLRLATPTLRFVTNVGATQRCPEILTQPLPVQADPGEVAQFAVTMAMDEPLTYQWRRGVTPMVNGPNVTGATSPTLTILAVTPEDAGDYSVTVTNGCGSVVSNTAALDVAQACDGDVNCDFALDGFDVEVQEKAVGGDVTDYCQADPDFNGDFALDGFDVEAVELVVGGGSCP